MRKLSILLVGLMLIAGLTVGAVADDSDPEETVDATFDIESIALLQIGESDVDLGTLESDDYSIDDGWDDVDNLESEDHEIKAFANFDYEVTVEGSDDGDKSLTDTDDFQMKGGDLDYSSIIDSSEELVSPDGGTLKEVDDIGYRYAPNSEDEPGDYKVTVTYTLSTQ